MTNKSGTLYTGVTNNIEKRVYEHKNKLVEGFTKKRGLCTLRHSVTSILPSPGKRQSKAGCAKERLN